MHSFSDQLLSDRVQATTIVTRSPDECKGIVGNGSSKTKSSTGRRGRVFRRSDAEMSKSRTFEDSQAQPARPIVPRAQENGI